jgi:hypothetical protein
MCRRATATDLVLLPVAEITCLKMSTIAAALPAPAIVPAATGTGTPIVREVLGGIITMIGGATALLLDVDPWMTIRHHVDDMTICTVETTLLIRTPTAGRTIGLFPHETSPLGTLLILGIAVILATSSGVVATGKSFRSLHPRFP